MSSSMIIAQSFDVEEVGKTIKSTKKRYTWKCQMDKSAHTIQLFASYLSSKRKIVHNGNIIYEGKKGVGKDFSFPFNIGKNLVFIYEIGESYSMKINNIEFSQIPLTEKSSSSYSNPTSKYVEPSFKGYDQYESSNKTRSQTTSDPKPKSGWDDVKKASTQARSSISGTTNSYTEKPVIKSSGNDYVEKQGTKYSQSTNANPISNTVNSKPKKDDSSDEDPTDFLDLASHFNKFDYKDGGNPSTNTNQATKSKSQPTANPSTNTRPSFTSNEPSPFESHQNTFSKTNQSTQNPKTQPIQQKQEDRKENKMDFGNFGEFGVPSQSQNAKKTAFDGFGGFDNFSSSQPSTKPTVQTNQSKISNQDLFGLDFTSTAQPTQSKPVSNNLNVFETSNEPTKLYGYDGYDSVYQPNKNTTQGGYNNQNSAITSNDLFGLDMGQSTQFNNNNNNYQQSYQQSYQQPSYQQPTQQKKTTGWNSDLMTLDLNGLDNAKNMGPSNTQNNQFGGFGGNTNPNPYGNSNTNSYGNQNQGSNPFSTNNVQGYSTQGGFGGLFDGSSSSNFGGNYGGNSNFGGNSNTYGGNTNFGGNSNTNGGNNPYGGYGQGYGQPQNTFNQIGGGFQNTNQVSATGNKIATPFDDDF